MKVYLDACCLNRPFDDQSQPRIRLETEAILLILEKLHRREWEWVGSEILLYEIRQNPDLENRNRGLQLAKQAHQMVEVTEKILQRAEIVGEAGFDAYDAIHLACAEAARADVFLTTDDQIIKALDNQKSLLAIQVKNPVRLLEEEEK